MFHNFSKGLLSVMAGLGFFVLSALPVGALSFAYSSPPNPPVTELEIVKDMDIQLKMEGSSSANQINLIWQGISSSALNFDFYNVIYVKGSHDDFDGQFLNNVYVTNNSFTLVNLKADAWWSFQVVPVKWSSSGYVEVASRSEMINVRVNGDENIERELSRPVISRPVNNKVLSNFPRKAILGWRSVRGADHYDISLQCKGCRDDNEGWARAVLYTSVDNKFVTPALSGDFDYRFRVRAVNDDGDFGSWSKFRYFRYDTSGLKPVNPEPVEVKVVDFMRIFTRIGWSKYEGDFDGYAVFLAKWTLSESVILDTNPRYFGPLKRTYTIFDLDDNTSYTAEIVPFVRDGLSRTLIYDDGSDILHFTTGSNDKD